MESYGIDYLIDCLRRVRADLRHYERKAMEGDKRSQNIVNSYHQATNALSELSTDLEIDDDAMRDFGDAIGGRW